jgi:sucrose phosphorylase
VRTGVQLITYVDRLGGGGVTEVGRLLRGPFSGCFRGVHLLPFFDPYDGTDAGYDPTDHARVDPRLGDWSDVAALGKEFELTVDLIVNHVSDGSPEFLDYIAHGDASPHADMFLTYDKVFGSGATEQDLTTIYRPRPGLPFTAITRRDGTVRLMWTTFTNHQIDLDVHSAAGWGYLCRILDRFQAAGIAQVRFDAIGYTVKTQGTDCFMTADTFAFIDRLGAEVHRRGMEVLVEVHGHHGIQLEIAGRVDRVYDFALPPLVLHTLHTGSSAALRRWLAISPRNAITVLDTHDGIGVVDVAAAADVPGLLTDEEVDALVETIHEASDGESRLATGAAASNLDLYQVNCTYYSALGGDDNRYLLARLVHLLSPGIPQVYYAGLLAARNDMELLMRTGVGREINRPYYTAAAIELNLDRPVVRQLIELIRLRNSHPAFAGELTVGQTPDHLLELAWTRDRDRIAAVIDLTDMSFELSWTAAGADRVVTTWDALLDA